MAVNGKLVCENLALTWMIENRFRAELRASTKFEKHTECRAFLLASLIFAGRYLNFGMNFEPE